MYLSVFQLNMNIHGNTRVYNLRFGPYITYFLAVVAKKQECPNVAKCGPENLRIRTLFTQW